MICYLTSTRLVVISLSITASGSGLTLHQMEGIPAEITSLEAEGHTDCCLASLIFACPSPRPPLAWMQLTSGVWKQRERVDLRESSFQLLISFNLVLTVSRAFSPTQFPHLDTVSSQPLQEHSCPESTTTLAGRLRGNGSCVQSAELCDTAQLSLTALPHDPAADSLSLNMKSRQGNKPEKVGPERTEKRNDFWWILDLLVLCYSNLKTEYRLFISGESGSHRLVAITTASNYGSGTLGQVLFSLKAHELSMMSFCQ